MGIYSSGMSCWERRRAGLANDHAGPTQIDDAPAPTVEVKTEDVVAVIDDTPPTKELAPEPEPVVVKGKIKKRSK